MRPVHSSAILALSLAVALAACGADAEESPASADQLRRRQDVHPRDRHRPRRARPAGVGRAALPSSSASSPTTRWSPSTARARSSRASPRTGRSTARPSPSSSARASPAPTARSSPPRRRPTTSTTSATPRTRAPSSASSSPPAPRPSPTGATVTLTLAGPVALRPQGSVEPADGLRRGPQGPRQPRLRDRRHRPVHARRGGRERPLHVHGPRGLRLGPRRRDDRRDGHCPRRSRPGRHQRDHRRQPAALPASVNAAAIIGPDAARLAAAELFEAEQTALITGEQWFNHTEGRPTADPAVRTALTQALDLGRAAEGHHVRHRRARDRARDPRAAGLPGRHRRRQPPRDRRRSRGQAALEEAGWAEGRRRHPRQGRRRSSRSPSCTTPPSGSGGAAAAELAVKAWSDFGVQVERQGRDHRRARADPLRQR